MAVEEDTIEIWTSTARDINRIKSVSIKYLLTYLLTELIPS
jgi:hypothetical protein